MIRLIIKRTFTCPEGAVTGAEFRTVDVEDATLEKALTPEHGYVGVQLLGAEVLPRKPTTCNHPVDARGLTGECLICGSSAENVSEERS